jgi:flagellin
MERLSSGFRINRAADDAAGLAVSEKLKSQIGGLNQASRNSQDGISMIQTAEGALDEVQSMMQRMRDLAVQASSDTNSQTERDNISLELDQLGQEIDSISSRTMFNGQHLLDGTLGSKLDTAGSGIQVGTNAGALNAGADGSVVSVNVTSADPNSTFQLTAGSNGGSQVILTETNLTTNATKAQTLNIGDITGANTDSTIDFSSLGVKITVNSGTNATLAGATLATDLLADANNGGGAGVVKTGTTSAPATLQTGANQGDETTVSFVDTRLTGNSTTGGSVDKLNTTLTTYKGDRSRVNATDLISALDAALGFISSSRATLGADQNRLQHTIANLGTTSENLSASNSRIRDVDVATESSNMAKNQVLEQAGVSVLAQANQMPQLALKLLG